MKLDPEQQRILALRDQYAQVGINYDKATRRFLAQHEGEVAPEAAVFVDTRPTLKFSKSELEDLRAQAAQL